MDYYKKYIKYKTKYFLLKNEIEKYQHMYNLFTTSTIKTYKGITIIEQPLINQDRKRSRDAITNTPVKSPYNNTFGEFTNRFLSFFSTGEKTKLIDDMKADDDIVRDIEIDQDEEYYDTYEEYGKTIECFVADKFKCPICFQKSLKRYSSDNFPAVDLVCVNIDHKYENGVKFFQVKSSSGANFNGKPYFNKEKRIIRVGSINYGSIIHNILPSNIDKRLLIGYICIKYRLSTDEQNLRILLDSFIVLPNLNVYNNDPYYQYIETGDNHPMITFTHNCRVINLANVTDDRIVPVDYFQPEKWYNDENPLQRYDTSLSLIF
jgi:hypothetical protein